MEEQFEHKPTRILIVDDHPIVLSGLGTLLSKEKGFSMEGGVDSAEAALAFLEQRPVDVVILDLRMPKTSGLDVLPSIIGRKNPPRVLILSTFDCGEEIYRAAKGGAMGYLMKAATGSEIIDAIRDIAGGHTHFPREIEALLEERKSRRGLSQREQEVLRMLSKGLTNKEIGRILLISEITVRNHVSHILEKLAVADRTEAVSIAIQQGLLTVS